MDSIQTYKTKEANPVLGFFARLVIVTLAICLLFNLYVITVNFLKKRNNASAFGVTPIVVVRGEEKLDDFVKPGELLFAFGKRMEKYSEGEKVAFSRNGWIYIGEIVGSEEENGVPAAFRVRAKYSEEEYRQRATESNLLGEISLRIPLLGYFILFLASLPGRILFVGTPLFVYLILLLCTELRERRLQEFPKPVPTPLPEKKPGKPDPRYIPGPTFLLTSLLTVSAIYYGTHPKKEKAPRKSKVRKKQPTPARVPQARNIGRLTAYAKNAASFAFAAMRDRQETTAPGEPIQGIYVGSLSPRRVSKSRAR